MLLYKYPNMTSCRQEMEKQQQLLYNRCLCEVLSTSKWPQSRLSVLVVRTLAPPFSTSRRGASE